MATPFLRPSVRAVLRRLSLAAQALAAKPEEEARSLRHFQYLSARSRRIVSSLGENQWQALGDRRLDSCATKVR